MTVILQLGVYRGELEVRPSKDLHTYVHRSVIRNNQKVGSTQMSINQ